MEMILRMRQFIDSQYADADTDLPQSNTEQENGSWGKHNFPEKDLKPQQCDINAQILTNIFLTRPKPPYGGKEQRAGSWGQDAVQAGTFWIGYSHNPTDPLEEVMILK